VQRFARQRRTEHDAGAVTARLGGLRADGSDAPPDLRAVLDLDPVVLHVLALGDVSGIAAGPGGGLASGTQLRHSTRHALAAGPPLRDIQRTAVAADPQHEVPGFEHIDLLVAGPGAVVTLLALGVQAPPAETSAQIALVDTVEPVLGVDVLDPGPDVERVVVLLGLLVRVERFPIAERPLALGAAAHRFTGAGAAGACGGFALYRGLGLRGGG